MCGVAPVRQAEWSEFIAAREDKDIPLAKQISPDDLDELSEADLAILQETWDRFNEIDRFELADWTHRFCPEWRDPRGSSIPIDFATVFDRLDKDEPVELAEQIQAERALLSDLKSG